MWWRTRKKSEIDTGVGRAGGILPAPTRRPISPQVCPHRRRYAQTLHPNKMHCSEPSDGVAEEKVSVPICGVPTMGCKPPTPMLCAMPPALDDNSCCCRRG